jgi:hypothetical protein
MTFSDYGLGAATGLSKDQLNSSGIKGLSDVYAYNVAKDYYDDLRKKGTSSSSGGSSNGSNGGGGGSSSSGVGLSDFSSAAKTSTDLAKDMAQFQLGINDQQSSQDQKYRFAEADHTLANTKDLNQQGFNFDTAKAAQQYGYTSALQGQAFGENTQLKQQDFRNTYALQGQQNTANLGLDAQRNTAQMAQLTKQTDTQKEMQSADFNNQTTQRAQAAALAQLGFRR